MCETTQRSWKRRHENRNTASSSAANGWLVSAQGALAIRTPRMTTTGTREGVRPTRTESKCTSRPEVLLSCAPSRGASHQGCEANTTTASTATTMAIHAPTSATRDRARARAWECRLLPTSETTPEIRSMKKPPANSPPAPARPWDDDADPWRHPPVEPHDQSIADSLGKSISD